MKKNQSVLSQALLSFLKNYSFVFILVAISLLITFFNPDFLTFRNWQNLTKQMVPTALLALGLMFVMVSGGIDLSVGFGISLSAVILGIAYLGTNNIYISIFSALACGLLMGLTNGLIITGLKILPFIATLATMSIFQGLTYIFSFGRLAWVKHPVTSFLGEGTFLGIPIIFIFLVLIYAVGFLIFYKTKIGTYAIAIGDNEESARLAGISINKYKMILYLLAGIFTALAAIVLIMRLEMTAPTIGGTGILLDAIAATVLGGTSLMGGKGNVIGTFFGSITITVIGNALNLLNISANYRDVFKGVVIILVLILDRVINAEKYKRL